MVGKVLILDDDPLIQSTLKQALELQHVDTRAAGRGDEGLKIIADWHPDLILLDHHMPEMTGIEFLHHLRDTAEFANIDVIYLTSDEDITHINEALALGITTYLNKSEVQVDDITRIIIDKLPH